MYDISNQTIPQELSVFTATPYVSSIVQPLAIFYEEISSGITLFQSSTFNSFDQGIQLTRVVIQGNFFTAALQTQVDINLIIDENATLTGTRMMFTSYINISGYACSCFITPTCLGESGIYDTYGQMMMPMPGILTACLNFDALVELNLDFFYNQLNIDEL
ncbi:unnamed protein product [Didymodactylos carnosus]|uniref:Uncharacterized protein n=1 Tax=Didymodactylos carnosus TaxID=1234261 RepID=A0A815PXL9_9BILA|nr:unnamed protein product [Didymodactylos carnosus]CAF1455869.1 unnamed protein product [Didymodactylos carnosus]CAF4050763.1 unnamed protein product [Didymodactylos carnosus]CAF4327725.1 unnamed protein product [Didymodactylos carnosus]